MCSVEGEEGEDDAKSACPLIPWATHVIQWVVQQAAIQQCGANPKNHPQFGLWAATRPHEAGIASNRGSASRGEYVLESCTHRPSIQGSRGHPKSLRLCRAEGELGNRE